MNGPATLIRTSHPRSPWLVIYTDPENREKNGRTKRVRKWFSAETLAAKHRDDLNKKLALVGTSGLALDAPARADFWAARQILDAAGHGKITFRELAEKHVTRSPAPQKSPKLPDLLPIFIAQKTDEEGASEQTTTSLENRLKQWWKRDGLTVVADLTKPAIEELRGRLGVGTETRRAGMGGTSSWLMDGTTRIGVSTLGIFPLEWMASN